MPARKQTILAYSLVAVVCLVVGFFAGRAYVKHQIRCPFENATASVGHVPSAQATTATKRTEPTTNAVSAEKPAVEAKAQSVKAQYIQQNLKLYDLHAKYMSSLLDRNVPGVTFKIKNKGTLALNEVDVTIYFKDANGRTISEASYVPVCAIDLSFVDNGKSPKQGYAKTAHRMEKCSSSDDNKNMPLKPGYIWQMERGTFYPANAVPSEWKPGAVTARITDIGFVPQGKSGTG